MNHVVGTYPQLQSKFKGKYKVCKNAMWPIDIVDGNKELDQL